MNKKVRLAVTWVTLIIMVGGIVASFVAYAIS